MLFGGENNNMVVARKPGQCSEMMRLLLFVTLSVLITFSSTNASSHDADDKSVCLQCGGCTPVLITEDSEEMESPAGAVEVVEGEPFTLACALNKFQIVKWSLNGLPLPSKLDFRVVTDENDGGSTTNLKVGNATLDHAGEYRCLSQCTTESSSPNPALKVSVNSSSTGGLDASNKPEGPKVSHMPFPKGHRSFTVIAGDKLDLVCTVRNAESSNYKLNWYRNGEPMNLDMKDSNLLISDDRNNITYQQTESSHAGRYMCQLVDINTNNNVVAFDEFVVRVRDKLGALWPFLGICGEVVILCVIILVYEKNKHKQEMEESDTDASPQ